MTNKKILFVCPNLGSGGSEKMLARIANYSHRKGLNCSVILLDGRNPHYQLDQGIEVFDLKLASMKQSFFHLIGMVKKIKPDLIFSTVTAMNVVVVLCSLFFRKVRLIARESSIISINNKHSKYGTLINWVVKLLYRRFDAIVAQSFAMKNDLIHNFNIDGNKIVQIYNPIEVPDALTMTARHGSGLTFVSVGNLRREKGYERILQALSGVTDLDFHYYIVGEGQETERLKQLCIDLKLNNKVTFTGKLSNPEKYYAFADLYLIGSYYEGFPNALLEAGLHGVPAIAYDVPGGIPEIMTKQSGILVEDGNIERYRMAIREAVAVSWDREAIALGIKARFDYETLMDKYYNLFLNV